MKKKRVTKSVKVLGEGTYLRLVKDHGWEYVQRRGCRGVVIIVAVTPDRRIVLTEQARRPVYRRVIEYPAGLVGDRVGSRRETVVQAAKRELLEETGYRAGKMTVLTRGPSSSGSSSVKVTFLRAERILKTHPGGGDGNEDITVHEVPLKDIEAWLNRKRRSGRLVDPKIYAGLYFLNKYN